MADQSPVTGWVGQTRSRDVVIRKIDGMLASLSTETLVELLCELSRMVPESHWPPPPRVKLQVIHTDR